MLKKLVSILVFISATLSQGFPFAPASHGHPHQQGLFLPVIRESTISTNANDVIYIRFCKALCYLYVPHSKTCGSNNIVYENSCMAKCDRVNVDATRLKFNDKCCCNHNSDLVDASWALGALNSIDVNTTMFCAHIVVTGTNGAIVETDYVNVFAIPQCLQTCLGIDDVSDLTTLNSSHTLVNGCTDNLNT